MKRFRSDAPLPGFFWDSPAPMKRRNLPVFVYRKGKKVRYIMWTVLGANLWVILRTAFLVLREKYASHHS